MTADRAVTQLVSSFQIPICPSIPPWFVISSSETSIGGRGFIENPHKVFLASTWHILKRGQKSHLIVLKVSGRRRRGLKVIRWCKLGPHRTGSWNGGAGQREMSGKRPRQGALKVGGFVMVKLAKALDLTAAGSATECLCDVGIRNGGNELKTHLKVFLSVETTRPGDSRVSSRVRWASTDQRCLGITRGHLPHIPEATLIPSSWETHNFFP